MAQAPRRQADIGTQQRIAKELKGAFETGKLKEAFEAAGASNVQGDPFDTLAEMAAQTTAPTLPGNRFRNLPKERLPKADEKVLKAVRAAVREESIQRAIEVAELKDSPETRKAIRELLETSAGAIATRAVLISKEGGRAVDSNVVATGAVTLPRFVEE